MWRLFSSEVAGRSHEQVGMPCQDKTLTICSRGYFFSGLADGAGSARYSDIGAECALRVLNTFLQDDFDIVFNLSRDSIKKLIIEIIQEALIEESLNRDIPVREMSSTLLFVARKGDRILVGHIGDGSILIHDTKGVHVLSAGVNGEFSNMTCFTTSSSVERSMFLEKLNTEDALGFLLISDGSEAGLLNKRQGLIARIIDRMFFWGSVQSYQWMDDKIRELLLILRKKTPDDCSIVLATKSKNALELSDDILGELLEINKNRQYNRRLRFFKEIILRLQKGQNIKEMSKDLYLPAKHLKKRILRLKEIGLGF